MRAGADWFVRSHEELLKRLKRHRVAVIGSGAWACAAARMIAQNTAGGPSADEFHDTVKMWVYEEDVDVRCTADAPCMARLDACSQSAAAVHSCCTVQLCAAARKLAGYCMRR